jgi:hypothetical protein
MALDADLKRYLILLFFLVILPMTWLYVNGDGLQKASLIYLVISLVLFVFYVIADKLK